MALLKVPIAMAGTIPHPDYGVLKYGPKEIREMKENFEKEVLGFKSFITFGHLDEEPQATDGQRKRGDITRMVIEQDEKLGTEVLSGYVDVPDSVHEAVQKKEFEYTSPEIIRNFMSKSNGDRIGAVVTRVALTNSPYLPWRERKVEALSQVGEDNSKAESYSLPINLADITKPLSDNNPSNMDINQELKAQLAALIREQAPTLEDTTKLIDDKLGPIQEQLKIATDQLLSATKKLDTIESARAEDKKALEEKLNSLQEDISAKKEEAKQEPEVKQEAPVAEAPKESEKVEEVKPQAPQNIEAASKPSVPVPASLDEYLKTTGISELQAELQRVRQAQETSAAENAKLRQEVAVLSQNHQQEENQKFRQRMVEMNLPPSVIQQIENAEGGEVKLSTSAGAKTVSTREALVNVLQELMNPTTQSLSMGDVGNASSPPHPFQKKIDELRASREAKK